MTGFIDYTTILTDLRLAVETAALGFKTVLKNANDRDFLIQNMPLLDLRLKRVDIQATTNATYYGTLTIEAEICAFDLTNREEAATLRDNLTNALQDWVRKNPRFSSKLDTTIVGQGEFGTGESRAEGAFVAGAVLEFHPLIYSE